MAAFSNFVGFLLVVLLSSTESETANITALIGKSASPSYAVEGKNFTIEWNYTLDGTIGSVQLVTVNDDGTDTTIGRGFSPGIVSVQGGFQARFKAQATETRAELTILAVQRSDEETYKLIVLPTGTGFISELVILDVNFPPKITKISANQKVIEGGNVTLICLVDGKPTPTITWTRLSDNSVVNMTLTDISRQEAGKYRCTGVNGIGRPARGDIMVAVRYAVKATGCGENATVPYGGNKTFSCPVDGNPKPNITWYMYNEVSERPIFSGENWTAGVTGCYTCVASNYLGTSVSVTQCLTVEESSTASAPSTSAPKHPSRTVIGVLIGVAVFMVILIGLVTCWVCKKKKCGKRTKNAERDYFEVDT